MSGKSTIEWTDASWNPVTGCTKVDRGCKHCYAERQTEGWPMFKGNGSFEKVELHPELLDWPLHRRKPLKIFVNSMSDLFHEKVTPGFQSCVWDTMQKAHWHTFQIVTKRAERMRQILECINPYPNVWLGISAHDDKTLTERWASLRQTPAAVRWLSLEPLLGEVPSLAHILLDTPRPDWVVAGGESGPHAEPSHPDHFRMVRDFCQAAGVPFFFKQWGEWADYFEASPWLVPGHKLPRLFVYRDGRMANDPPENWPDDKAWQAMYRITKKRAGRLLDGREWNEMPCPR